MADREKKKEDGNTKTWISQKWKEIFRWNKKHFSYFLRGYHLVKNKNLMKNSFNNKKKNTNTGSSISLKQPSNFSLLFNKFNELSSKSINKNPGGCCEPLVHLGQSTGGDPGSSTVFLIQIISFVLNLIMFK